MTSTPMAPPCLIVFLPDVRYLSTASSGDTRGKRKLGRNQLVESETIFWIVQVLLVHSDAGEHRKLRNQHSWGFRLWYVARALKSTHDYIRSVFQVWTT